MTPSLTPRQDAVRLMMASPPADPRRARIHRIVNAVMFEFAKMADEDEEFPILMASISECLASSIKSVCATITNGHMDECAKLESEVLRAIKRTLNTPPHSSIKQSFSDVVGTA